MTQLQSYIAEACLKQSALADTLGISRGYMSELVSGSKTPSLEIAVAIERATGGAVPAASWIKTGEAA
jgi:DNA-binding transcriptional regulator YdaS (Cro superfamily)